MLVRSIHNALLTIVAGGVCCGCAWGQNCPPVGILALIRGEFPDKDALVAMYNRYLTNDGHPNPACDMGVSFPYRSALAWVDRLQGIQPPGGKQTSYFSIADIQSNIATDRSLGVEWIFYDLEGGLSPADEVADPINSINRAATMVHNAGLKFGFTVVNVGRHPREIVPYVVANADGYNPQGQGFMQQGCNVYAREVGEVLILAKQHNPSLRLWAQLSLLRGTVETNQQCLMELVNYLAQRGYRLDAVTMFYGLDSSHVVLLDQFYQWYTQQYRALSGDADQNGCIDDADLLQVLFAFGETGNPPADVNCDGTVDDADLLIVLFNFGSGC